jgi:lysozyme family protein
MTDAFATACDAMLKREGGFVLHTVAGDRGGMTYAGIARNMNPRWPGWEAIDRGETPPTQLVRDFYKREYWDRVRGDDLPPVVAASVFDFAVNAGVKVAAKLAQVVAGCAPDGVIGPKSIDALSAMSPELFRSAYALAKIKRYAEIVNRDRSQSKFLLGWLNRTLEQV